MSELLPCPFCGNTPVLVEIEPHSHAGGIADFMPDHPGSAYIDCACGVGCIDATKEAVAERWNMRAASPSAAQQPMQPRPSAENEHVPLRGPDCACCELQPRKDCTVPGCSMKDVEWALPARHAGSLQCLRCGTVDAFAPALNRETK